MGRFVKRFVQAVLPEMPQGQWGGSESEDDKESREQQGTLMIFMSAPEKTADNVKTELRLRILTVQ